MNTFFISPLIPLKFYIIIQKEKNNPILQWDAEEIKLLSNINILFDYSKELSDDNKEIIANIIKKITDNIPEYNNLAEKLTFVNQNTFKEITNYNYVYYYLLKERNYEQIINPYSVDSINMCVGLSDTGPLVELDTSKFKSLTTDPEKYSYINNLIESKQDNIKHITHDIMSRSHVDSKINTITKILSNKSVLYYTLKGEDFIPLSSSFEITDEDSTLNNLINNFITNTKSKYFVIKPAEGTLSDGVGIFKKDELNLNFIKVWTLNHDNNKYAITGQYSTWILSEFIQSFLWKLQGENITSKVFPQLAQKEPLLKFNYNDNIGRINKFRFWALYTIIDGEFTSYLYKNGYCEIALEELTTYSKTQLDPADIETYYQNLLNIEEDPDKLEEIVKKGPQGPQNLEDEKIEAAFIGTYLDYARVVNESNYPLGQNAWNNTLMPQMYSLVNTLADKMKRFMNCLNKYKLEGSKGCYSFFALDIIIDSNSKPWLLETNSRPFVGFGNYFNRYDTNNEHVLNVNNVFNSVLGLTTDIVNTAGNKNVNYSDFLVTNIDHLSRHLNNKIYVPLSLGITQSPTSKVYNEIYSILDNNNYVSFPYSRQIGKSVKKSIGFRGMSPISKFLISKISELGNDKFISLMQDLFPYDAKMKVLNRINTLAFYLGDKAEMTKILKSNVNNWDSIIPYSETINISLLSDDEILNKIQNSPLNNSKIIAKPAYGQQGKGIIISDDPNVIIDEMKNNEDSEKDFVISKYLDDPYLIKLNKTGVVGEQGQSSVIYNDTYGRKAHLRAYVLVQRIKNELKVYLYKESLIFCAAKEYNSCNEQNKEFCNLTNLYFGSKYYKEVLNKNPGDAYKDLSGLARNMISNEHYDKFMNRIKYIIKTTILAVKDDLLCINDNNNCYQYIAFDLHLENEKTGNDSSNDSSNKVPIPWLLEVNATPGLKSPDYQWQDIGGLNNFLESILNITIETKMSKSGKQLFEYLPFNKKVSTDKSDKLIIDKINKENNIDKYSCISNYYEDLKKVLRLLNYPGRSYLTTKNQMCNAIKNI